MTIEESLGRYYQGIYQSDKNNALNHYLGDLPPVYPFLEWKNDWEGYPHVNVSTGIEIYGKTVKDWYTECIEFDSMEILNFTEEEMEWIEETDLEYAVKEYSSYLLMLGKSN